MNVAIPETVAAGNPDANAAGKISESKNLNSGLDLKGKPRSAGPGKNADVKSFPIPDCKKTIFLSRRLGHFSKRKIGG